MGQTTSKNHKNKRKSISKLFHAQTGSIWFQIDSYLVPIGSYGFYSSQIGSYKLKMAGYLTVHMHMHCSKIGSRWFSTLYILSPNFHMLEQTSASLQTRNLTGIFSEHDLRTLRTACQCLNSLCIRVEARANTVERAMIEQQLQFMQTRVQPVPTEDLRTADTSFPEPMPTIVCRKIILTDHPR